MKGTLLILCIIVSAVSFSSAAETTPNTERAPFIQLDIKVDTQGIEQAIQQTNHEMEQVAAALHKIAENKELTPEQAALISTTTENINHLAISSSEVVDALPDAISKTRESLATNAQLFLSDLETKILILLGIVVAALVALIACLYWFIVKPMQGTIVSATTNVANMAKTIQATAASLEESNKTHVKILSKLEQEGEGC